MTETRHMDEWLAQFAARLKARDTEWLTLEAIRTRRSSLSQEEEEAFGVVGDPQPYVRLHYAWVLSEIIEGLTQLPEFANGDGLSALTALRIDIATLDAGGNPARLRRDLGDGSANVGKKLAMANVILCVRLMEGAEVGMTAAREKVAAIFTAAGHKGQQGGSLSPGTINNWDIEISSAGEEGRHAAGRRLIKDELEKWMLSPSWPPSEAEAVAFAERRARIPAFSLALTT